MAFLYLKRSHGRAKCTTTDAAAGSIENTISFFTGEKLPARRAQAALGCYRDLRRVKTLQGASQNVREEEQSSAHSQPFLHV